MREPEPQTARRILLMVDDRRFRELACTLLTRRGYAVAVCPRGADLAQTAVSEAADVVLLDASGSLTAAARESARLAALTPRVGIVAVSAGPHSGLAALPVLPKWSSFEALFAAIESACTDLAAREVPVTSEIPVTREAEITSEPRQADVLGGEVTSAAL